MSIKIVSLDSRIFAYFPKGLTHDFGKKKIAFFSFYVFGQKQSRNNVWGSFLGYKNRLFR